MIVEELFPYRHQTWSVLKPAIEKLTSEQLEWSAGDHMPIGETLWHMADTEQWWLQKVCRKRPEFMVKKPPLADVEALLSVYESVRMLSENFFDPLTPEDLEQPIEQKMFEGIQGLDTPGTVRWAIHHVFEHESYHAGQIALLMRLQGLRPPKF